MSYGQLYISTKSLLGVVKTSKFVIVISGRTFQWLALCRRGLVLSLTITRAVPCLSASDKSDHHCRFQGVKRGLPKGSKSKKVNRTGEFVIANSMCTFCYFIIKGRVLKGIDVEQTLFMWNKNHVVK